MSAECYMRGLCRFVSDFIRLILFFASILFMMVSVFLFAKSFQGIYTFNAIGITNTNSSFLIIIATSIYLIALSVLGIYATFFHNGALLEWFAMLAGMNVLIGLAVFMYTSPRLGDTSADIAARLRDLQPKYDWSASLEETTIDDKLTATRKWDIIQLTYRCCGVQSREDWRSFMPKNSTNEFPASCCYNFPKEESCSQKNSWPDGCVPQIEAANARVSVLLSSSIIVNLLLSTLGNLVICCLPKQDYLAF